MPFRSNKAATIDFTGGEPTANPEFVEFSSWLRKEHKEKYQEQFSLEVCLTSNGIISDRMRESLVENYEFATFSYHCEATESQKIRFFNNIEILKSTSFNMKINVMFHARDDYFEECLSVCERLRALGVDFVPRLIGDKDNKDRYNHQYSSRQINWMKEYWKNPEAVLFQLLEPRVSTADKPDCEKKQCSASSLGRPCCGSRNMKVCGGSSQWRNTKFLESTDFKDWYCSVNWFFLHIEQQTGQVFHHQTCQATFDYGRGPIGLLSDTGTILTNLKERIATKSMPIIRCSRRQCGCGLCAPKAQDLGSLLKIFPKHVDADIFQNRQPIEKT